MNDRFFLFLQDPSWTELSFLKIDDYMVFSSVELRDRVGRKEEEKKGEEVKAEEEVEEQEEEEDWVPRKKKRPVWKSGCAVRVPDRRLYGCPFCGFVNLKKMWVEHLKEAHKDKNLIFCEKKR